MLEPSSEWVAGYVQGAMSRRNIHHLMSRTQRKPFSSKPLGRCGKAGNRANSTSSGEPPKSPAQAWELVILVIGDMVIIEVIIVLIVVVIIILIDAG